MKNKGFTLIELLVVIAIISILSSIIIASLGTSRAKAKDAAIQEELVGFRSSAEIFHSDNNQSYGIAYSDRPCLEGSPDPSGSLFASIEINKSLLSMMGLSGQTGTYSSACGVATDRYVVAIKAANQTGLPGGQAARFWCLDSTKLTVKETFTANLTSVPVSFANNLCL